MHPSKECRSLRASASRSIVCRPFWAFRTIHPPAGVTLRSPLPMVCHSFGVLVTLSHQSRGHATLHPCLWSATPSEFLLLSPIKTGVALRFTTCLWSATPSEFGLLSPIKTGVALRFTPACNLVSPSGLLFIFTKQ